MGLHERDGGCGPGDDGEHPADAAQPLHLGRRAHDEQRGAARPSNVFEVEREADWFNGACPEPCSMSAANSIAGRRSRPAIIARIELRWVPVSSGTRPVTVRREDFRRATFLCCPAGPVTPVNASIWRRVFTAAVPGQ
jgi:hypothetical protein